MIMAKGETLQEVWRRGLAELHPPLAHFIRHYLLMISADAFHQRLFGIAASLLSIIGMYRVGFLLRGSFLGLFCALCFAFLPVAVSTSISIRNYAFFMAFLSWALYYFVRYQRQEKHTDLFLFTLLLFLASATHFTGFLVTAAIGLSQGWDLISKKRWHHFALFSASFLPLLLLGVFSYLHFLAPGTAGPMWNQISIETASLPDGFLARFISTCWMISNYFCPLIGIVEPTSDAKLFILVFSALLLFSLYIKCVLSLRLQNTALYSLVISVWAIALFSTLTNLYPLSPGRHSYYLLPFVILPLGYGLENLVYFLKLRRFAQYLGAGLIVLTVLLFKEHDIYLKYETEFVLKQKKFNAGQQFLDQHLKANDLIDTERFSYHYFLYAKDAGLTPYDNYAVFPYYHETTVIAPFDPPFKSYHNWEPFRENLKLQINADHSNPERKIWFVMYGYKNTEIWHLSGCEAIKSHIQDYFSLDGVLIFSLKTTAMFEFLKDDQAWVFCFADYKPLLSGEPFKARPRLNQAGN